MEIEMKGIEGIHHQTDGSSKEDAFDSKLIAITRMINKLQEDFIPQKIERALETVDAKINVAVAKQK
jgi:hypothetical protein